MTDQPTSEATAPLTPSSADQGPLTAGQCLRAARLKAGVHLAVLSVTLKIPVKQLEALEADQLDPAKGPVFFRGLASAICRHLQVDPAPVLALLPSVSGQLPAQRRVGELTSARRHGPVMHASVTRDWPRVVAWAAAMLLLIGSLLWLPAPSQWLWLQDLTAWSTSLSQEDEPSAPDASALGLPVPQTSDAPGGTVLETVPVPLAAAGADAAPAQPVNMGSHPPIAAPVTGASSSSLSQNASPVVPLQTTRQDAAPAIGRSSSAEWVFSTSSESWLELKNSAGTVVWSGLLKAGQPQKIQSPLPVRVVVGRAQEVTASLRGQPFDLKPHTQVNVARFEVKE